MNSKILVRKYRDDIFKYYERSESQRLRRIDLELDATWNLIAHAHLYTQNMEAEKEEVLVALES